MDLLTMLSTWSVAVARKLVFAVLIYLIGRSIIRKGMRLIDRYQLMAKLDPTAASFIRNIINGVLYLLLCIMMIGVLGVPMASVIAVLASAGLAVGMALQGSLSNLAGGIMLLIFRPFNVEDYIAAAGVDGTVKEINMFYTVLLTPDNRTITVPNGTMMSSHITNFSRQENRRVDWKINVGTDADPEAVKVILLEKLSGDSRIFRDPEPFAELSAVTRDYTEITIRVWVRNADYWDVYFEALREMNQALRQAGVAAPALHVIQETK